MIGKSDKKKVKDAELRWDSEQQLDAPADVTIETRTPEAIQKLLHELEVHQVELEMQNEELRRVRDELEKSRNKYAELYEFAPVGYFTFDIQGIINDVNLTGTQLLGKERRLLTGVPFINFIADQEGREAFAHHLKKILKTEGLLRCEVKIKALEGKVIYGQIQSKMVGSINDRSGCILSSLVDNTLGKEFEMKQESAHDQMELLVTQRTSELSNKNEQLTQEIELRQRIEESLLTRCAEIKALKSRLEAENVYLQHEVARSDNFGQIIGQSRALTKVFKQIEQVAPQEATVLLLGETGTGKGVIARAIHSRSDRNKRPMVTVNCTSLPANLIESELFGREKGAFTGANARQIGRFELADGGTIFLDEIGEMPLELQPKLLRVIQDGEFERLGSPRSIKVDVRIIAASNRNLEEEISNGGFRSDLFYRLNVFPITIPPLRQRKDDIPLLVNNFVTKFNKKMGKNIQSVSKETLDLLHAYDWPGNVRELESIMERAVIVSRGSTLEVLDKFAISRQSAPAAGEEIKSIAELEHDHILMVLQKTSGRIEGKNGAAALLGLNPSTLRARMRKLGITRK